ncbi:ISAs1 family transposase [Actinomyces qiguomingii]|uniref:ISAs1 family transposase n=2 Tax=Actinomyces qiguomingii TaxID=2057800 RepID=UPI000FFE67F1|nr:ISAs1 family transposase [Actinomyces qiguomingii]
MSSSTTPALSRQPLTGVFATVPDPRDRRGCRHRLDVVLALAAVGVLAGCRTLLAIWEHAQDLTGGQLQQLGLPQDRGIPSESTIRRALAGLDADDLDARIASWVLTRTGTIDGRRIIAVDGKTMRGAKPKNNNSGDGDDGGGGVPHLLAALDQGTGAVVAQQRVADKTSEIPALKQLLAPHDLTGAVVTADALHTQTDTAQWIRDRGADYLLTVKNNQPGLKAKLKALPWKDVPAVSGVDTSHGRRVRRTIKAVATPDWIEFPGAAQVLQVRRTRTTTKHQPDGSKKSKRTTEVVYLVCSIPPEQAPPEQVAAWIQGHWAIENRLHWVRDVTYDEDRHQLRTGSGPQVMATLRNLAISLIRTIYDDPATTSIASANRAMTRRPTKAIKLLTTP